MFNPTRCWLYLFIEYQTNVGTVQASSILQRDSPPILSASRCRLFAKGRSEEIIVVHIQAILCRSSLIVLFIFLGMIIGSVLSKCSIPIFDSAATIMQLTKMPYSGINSLFIRILLNKKYSLPVSVIEAVVNFFQGFEKVSHIYLHFLT